MGSDNYDLISKRKLAVGEELEAIVLSKILPLSWKYIENIYLKTKSV